MPQCAILPLGKPGLRTSSIAAPCRGDWQQLATSPRQDSGLGSCLFPRLWQPAKLLLRGREAAQVAIVMGPTAGSWGGGGSLPGAAARGQLARRGCERAACPARLREGSLPGAAARRAACPARLREGSLPGAAARGQLARAAARGQLARRGCERAACPARLREGSLPGAAARGQLARRGCERAACPARLREGSLPGAAARGQLARCGSEGGGGQLAWTVTTLPWHSIGVACLRRVGDCIAPSVYLPVPASSGQHASNARPYLVLSA